MSASRAKIQRLADANVVILEVGMRGRRFFYSGTHDRFARFQIDYSGRLRFVDDHTGRAVAVIKGGRWRGFSHGGTMRWLVEALARYIRHGEPISPGHFGPWADHICEGDLWGYGRDQMSDLRLSLEGNAAVQPKADKP